MNPIFMNPSVQAAAPGRGYPMNNEENLCLTACELGQRLSVGDCVRLDGAVSSVRSLLNMWDAKHAYTESERVCALKKAVVVLELAVNGEGGAA